MGGIVNSAKNDYEASATSPGDRGDWFSKQGYSMKIPLKVNVDAVADGQSRVYDLGRFSCSLPSTNPTTLQRNNDIYEHIKKMKSDSWLTEAESSSHATK